MKFNIQDVVAVLGERCERVADNAQFASVIEKTGISNVFATEGTSLDLARSAVQQLVDLNRGLRDKIDVLVCVSQSPVDLLPSMSCRLQHECNLPSSILAFDLGQGCSGFVQALAVSVRLMTQFENIVVVCVDTYRSKLDPLDRSTSAVFSDAASATWLSSKGDLSMIAESHYVDGSGRKYLFQELNRGREQGVLRMSGADVLLFTQRVVPAEIDRLLTFAKVQSGEVDNWLMHQASKLVLDGLEARIMPNVPFWRNIDRVGNTVSSSIPFLLAERLADVYKKKSILCGFGVGLSVSSALIVPSS